MRLALIALLLLAFPALAEPISPDRIRVIDGDTIRLDQKRPDIRLVGFNTPETRRAKCAAERIMGGLATKRLREIVRSGDVTLEIVKCACRPGTHGTKRCNFGRRCGILRQAGTDVGETLIAEELAVPFHCGETRCPKMPRPWCERGR